MAAKTTKASKATKANKSAKATKATKPAKVETPKNAEDVYRAGGGYWSSIRALRILGLGKMHDFDKVIAAVRKVMTEAKTFKAFKSKEQRNDNGKDVDGRILQNVCVTARKDYGEPLRKIGLEVRWDGRQKECGLFKMKK